MSKTVCVLTTAVTLAVLSNKSQDAFSTSALRIFGEEKQWWRLFSSLFSLASVWELMLTLHLARTFRILERHLGSSKYASFLVLAAVLTKSIELALCIQFPYLRQPSGPLSILSALTTMYYGYVPCTTPIYFTLGDFRITEKVFTYVAILSLAFHDSWDSLLPAGCGVMVALLYCPSFSPLQSFRVPGQILFSVLGTLFPSGDQIAERRRQMTRIQRRIGAGRPGQAHHLLGQGPGAAGGTGLRQRVELPPPREEDIALLMGLGFDRSTVVRVLRSSGNNTEAAANRLLGH